MHRFAFWKLWALALGLALFLSPALSYADCIELKNDDFDESKNTSVSAIRSFCISEQHGVIFKADSDLVIQKVRMLISGDGKNIMESTTLKLRIYKEKAAGSADPGAEMGTEVPYQVPPANKATPSWFEVKELNFSVKKGESFRVVFAHATIDCEQRVTPGAPLCSAACSWWGATSDTGPIKPKTNVIDGRLFSCPEVTDHKWRFFEDIPAKCRPSGNLILRVFAYNGTGKDCKGGGVVPPTCAPNSTQKCACTGGKDGVQTCKADGTGYGTCECGGNQSCTPNSTQKCACSGGKDGVQTCKSDGTGFDACKCEDPPKACAPNATQKCTCTGGKDGVQTCKSDGSGYDACDCSGKPVCQSGSTQKCACTKGEGVQSCKSDGSGWDDCKCEGNGGGEQPVVEKVTPNEFGVGKNTDVTIIGKNFVDGATVMVGSSIEALNVKVVGGTTITAVIPSETPAGKHNITVKNPDGKSGSLLDAVSIITGGCGCFVGSDGDHLHADGLLFLGLMLWIGFLRRRRHGA